MLAVFGFEPQVEQTLGQARRGIPAGTPHQGHVPDKAEWSPPFLGRTLAQEHMPKPVRNIPKGGKDPLVPPRPSIQALLEEGEVTPVPKAETLLEAPMRELLLSHAAPRLILPKTQMETHPNEHHLRPAGRPKSVPKAGATAVRQNQPHHQAQSLRAHIRAAASIPLEQK